jgi:hypothetical protein
MRLKPVNMFWVGPSLGRIEQLSIKSFLAAGHRVNLHCYQPIENVPVGTQLVDAAQTLSLEEANDLVHGKTKSYALASDLFRFRLMRDNAGFWSDTDVVCLRPVEMDNDYVFGWESDKFINGAFLYIDRNAPLLKEAINSFRENYIPPWTRWKKAVPLHFKRMLGAKFGPRDLAWGSFGPRALTYLARKHGVASRAQKQMAFYPLTLKDAPRIFESDFQLDVLPETYMVHLWNERLKHLKHLEPAKGSILGRYYRRFDV